MAATQIKRTLMFTFLEKATSQFYMTVLGKSKY